MNARCSPVPSPRSWRYLTNRPGGKSNRHRLDFRKPFAGLWASRTCLKTVSIESGRTSQSGVGRAMRSVERSGGREFNLPEGQWLTLAPSFVSAVVRAGLPPGRGSGGAPSEQRGEPLSDERASRWHLLSEGAFSEAGRHRVQAPSRRRSVRAVHAALSKLGIPMAVRREVVQTRRRACLAQ